MAFVIINTIFSFKKSPYYDTASKGDIGGFQGSETPPVEREASGCPLKGGLNQQLKCKFGINAIDSDPQLSSLYKRGAGGDLLQLVLNPPKSPFFKGGLNGKDC